MDYQSIKELDYYEDEGVDEQEVDLNPEARRRAQKELEMRQATRYKEHIFMEDYIDED